MLKKLVNVKSTFQRFKVH